MLFLFPGLRQAEAFANSLIELLEIVDVAGQLTEMDPDLAFLALLRVNVYLRSKELGFLLLGVRSPGFHFLRLFCFLLI